MLVVVALHEFNAIFVVIAGGGNPRHGSSLPLLIHAWSFEQRPESFRAKALALLITQVHEVMFDARDNGSRGMYMVLAQE